MNRRVTAGFRTCAQAVLCVVGFSLCAPALVSGHSDSGPSVCPELEVTAAHPVDQFEGVLPTAATEHCPLCHWLRAVAQAAPRPAAAIETVLDQASQSSRPAVVRPQVQVAVTLPPRAPPVR